MKTLYFLLFLLFGGVWAQDDGLEDILNDLESTPIEEMKRVTDAASEAVSQAAPVVFKSAHLSESYYRLYLVFGVLFTAVVFMWIILRHIGKTDGHNSEDVIAAAGLVIVVMGTLFIVIAATTTEALTAAIGLIGAVCGYVLGSLKEKKKKNQEEPKLEKAS